MRTLVTLITGTLAALPLIAAAQTTNDPGGQASTALPPDVTAPSTTSTPKAHTTHMKRPKNSNSALATDRNTEPGVNIDTATKSGPDIANTGQTQPRGSTPSTPSKKAE